MNSQQSAGYSNGYATSTAGNGSHYHNGGGGHYNNGGPIYNGNRGSMPRDENDSGQGSSLDKDYALYNNAQQYKSSPYARGGGSNNGGYGSSSQNGGGPYASGGSANVQNGGGGGQYSTNGGQFYYNVPHNSSAPPPPPTGGPPATPQRRPDGLDLSNREYRGSAFELYKKPSHYSFSNGGQQQVNGGGR